MTLLIATNINWRLTMSQALFQACIKSSDPQATHEEDTIIILI